MNRNKDMNMEKGDEFDQMALKLARLNFAFESARTGEYDRDILRLYEEFEEPVRAVVETEPSDSV